MLSLWNCNIIIVFITTLVKGNINHKCIRQDANVWTGDVMKIIRKYIEILSTVHHITLIDSIANYKS